MDKCRLQYAYGVLLTTTQVPLRRLKTNNSAALAGRQVLRSIETGLCVTNAERQLFLLDLMHWQNLNVTDLTVTTRPHGHHKVHNAALLGFVRTKYCFHKSSFNCVNLLGGGGASLIQRLEALQGEKLETTSQSFRPSYVDLKIKIVLVGEVGL